MRVISGLDKLESSALSDVAVTTGTFDGVHLGHRRIIATLLDTCQRESLRPVLLTFHPHPQMVLGRRGPVEILTTLEEKLDLLSSIGVETVIVLEFNRQLASYPPEEFVQQILVGKLKMKALVIGYDHAFGKDRAGNKDLLSKLASELGFLFTVVPEFRIDGQVVKSTRIRKELKSGDYALAKRALGYDYIISGKIVKGHGVGKALGYPTVNLTVPPAKLLPKKGVYSGIARFDGRKYPGMIYIGERLTFDDCSLSVEINLLDFKSRVESDHIVMELKDYIRAPERFGTAEQLAKRIREDEVEIKKRLK